MTSEINKYRIRILVSLLIIIPSGFYTKLHTGVLQDWVNNSLGSILYEIFWILLIALLFPRITSWKIALTVCIITNILEVLQLWHPFFLELIRSTFLGRTILGNYFTWNDFPYYFIGSILGWGWISKIKKKPELLNNSGF